MKQTITMIVVLLFSISATWAVEQNGSSREFLKIEVHEVSIEGVGDAVLDLTQSVNNVNNSIKELSTRLESAMRDGNFTKEQINVIVQSFDRFDKTMVKATETIDVIREKAEKFKEPTEELVKNSIDHAVDKLPAGILKSVGDYFNEMMSRIYQTAAIILIVLVVLVGGYVFFSIKSLKSIIDTDGIKELAQSIDRLSQNKSIATLSKNINTLANTINDVPTERTKRVSYKRTRR